MRRFVCLYFILFIFSTDLLISSLPKPSNDYVLLTLPKSGTFMIKKLLEMISQNKSAHLSGIKALGPDRHSFVQNPFVLRKFLSLLPTLPSSIDAHFNLAWVARSYIKKHPNHTKIVLIRDLRDICLSTTFFIDKPRLSRFYGNISFDEKLMHTIISEAKCFKDNVFNVRREAEEAIEWLRDPSVIVCRFEDLCGEQGGGTRSAQEKQILKIASALDVSLSSEELESIINNLWGGTKTFRKGQTGGWRKYFKPHHIAAFKEHLGQLLIDLGYEKNNNW